MKKRASVRLNLEILGILGFFCVVRSQLRRAVPLNNPLLALNFLVHGLDAWAAEWWSTAEGSRESLAFGWRRG